MSEIVYERTSKQSAAATMEFDYKSGPKKLILSHADGGSLLCLNCAGENGSQYVVLKRSEAAALARVLANFAETGELRAGEDADWSYIPTQDGERVWYQLPGDPNACGKAKIWLSGSTGLLFCENTPVREMLDKGYKFAKVEDAPPPAVREENAQ